MDLLLGGLICLGGLALFLYGGGFGFAIIIIVASLYKCWFPIKETPGDMISREEEKYKRKRILTFKDIQWQLSLADNPGIRKAQLLSIAVGAVSLVYGIFTLRFGLVNQIDTISIGHINLNYPNIRHFSDVEIVLFCCYALCHFIAMKEEYSKNKTKKIKKGLYKWKPWKYKGMNHCIADKYISKWKTYDQFNEKIRSGSYRWGYRFFERKVWSENEFADTYLREYDGKISLDIIQLIRVPQIQKRHIDMVSEYFSSFIQSYFEEKDWKTPITLTFVLCVDEISDTYREMIDVQIQQVEDRYVIPAGIIFPDGDLCITTFWKNRGNYSAPV